MRKPFIISTTVLKLFVTSLGMFILFCSFMPAHANSNKTATFESVRKNLWYTGVNSKIEEMELHAYMESGNIEPQQEEATLPEELIQALIKEEANDKMKVL